MAYSNMSQLRMLARDSDAGTRLGRTGDRARRAARRGPRSSSTPSTTSARPTASAATRRAGRSSSAASTLALAAGLEEHAARAYTNLASQMVESRDYARRRRATSSGHRLLPRARSRLLAALHDGLAGPLAPRPGPLGRGRRRRDDGAALPEPGRAEPDQAAHRGRAAACPPGRSRAVGVARRGAAPGRGGSASCSGSRRSPSPGPRPAGSTASSSSLRARPARRSPSPSSSGDPWAAGELACWRRRAGIGEHLPEAGLAEPCALELAGDGEAAARCWSQLGCPYEAALALTAAETEQPLRRSLAELAAARRDPDVRLRGAHAARRPASAAWPWGRGRRPAPTRAASPAASSTCWHSWPKGCGTREIAARLHLSEKTVHHHVSAILHKLAVPTRGQAVAEASRLGIGKR